MCNTKMCNNSTLTRPRRITESSNGPRKPPPGAAPENKRRIRSAEKREPAVEKNENVEVEAARFDMGLTGG